MSNIHHSTLPDLPLRAIPPLTALLAFERAASQLSFRRAARDLALSPSAISHQIRGLEALFGVKLFVRGARSVRLTADGERYLAKVSSALAALQEAGREMLRHRRDRGGELWISALPFFTSTVLIPALADFKRPSRTDSARRSDPSICRLQQLTRRCRHPLWPRAFGRPQIRAADRGQGLAGLRTCVDQRRPARARRFVVPGPDPPDVTAARLAALAQAGRDFGNDPARSALAR